MEHNTLMLDDLFGQQENPFSTKPSKCALKLYIKENSQMFEPSSSKTCIKDKVGIFVLPSAKSDIFKASQVKLSEIEIIHEEICQGDQ